MSETNKDPCRLYILTPPAFDVPAFIPKLESALDAGDVAVVQLRMKDVSDDEIRRAADILRPIVQNRDVAFILNDRPDLARECGCDGVHIGDEDGTYENARKLVGPDAIIGVTAKNSPQKAMEGGEAGADYVAFGAFFQTTTKQDTVSADLDLLTWWHDMTLIPCVAIGGITPENCAPVVRAGADFLAVTAAVWDHPQGPGAAVKAFHHAIESAYSRLLA